MRSSYYEWAKRSFIAVVEAGVTAAAAAVAGIAALTNRIHTRINDLDKRVDRMELNIAQNYVSKTEFMTTMEKLEDHMVRIEQKLDTFIQRFPRQ